MAQLLLKQRSDTRRLAGITAIAPGSAGAAVPSSDLTDMAEMFGSLQLQEDALVDDCERPPGVAGAAGHRYRHGRWEAGDPVRVHEASISCDPLHVSGTPRREDADMLDDEDIQE
jgi:hypothetical protein